MTTIHHISMKRSGHVFTARMIRSWLNGVVWKDWENTPPAQFHPHPQHCMVVLQVRDLLNWFASYANHMADNLHCPITELKFNRLEGMVRRWWGIAREFYGQTNHLRDYRVVLVDYDMFFVDQQYRQFVCTVVGGKYSEHELNTVTNSGRGSSFNRTQYNGKAQQMDTLVRYRQLEAPGLYTEMFHRVSGLKEFYLEHGTVDEDKLHFLNTT